MPQVLSWEKKKFLKFDVKDIKIPNLENHVSQNTIVMETYVLSRVKLFNEL